MEIELTQGKVAIVDSEDYKELSKYKWCYCKVPKGGYALRNSSRKDGIPRNIIFMHREINKTPEGMETDHINRNKLDNRKENLRSCTSASNRRNREARLGCSSAYRGVTWSKRGRGWIAQARYDQERFYLGFFADEVTAALAYDTFMLKKGDRYATLNFLRLEKKC